MLYHVSAEEIAVAQVVDRPVERREHHEQGGEEVTALQSARLVVDTAGDPEVQHSQRDDSENGARMNRPPPPVDDGDGVEKRQDQHATSEPDDELPEQEEQRDQR